MPLDTVTITIPANHPIFRCLGGAQYQAVSSDLVTLARNARAVQAIACLESRRICELMLAQPSGSEFRAELYQRLRERGVTKLEDIDYQADNSLSDLFVLWQAEQDRARKVAA